jgi:hypothetical protein
MAENIVVDRIAVHEVDYHLSTELVLIGHDSGKKEPTRYVGRVTWEEIGDYPIQSPTLHLLNQRPETAQALQRLADELWLLGYRPEPARGSTGQLEAVTTHLKDMQRLVFSPGRRR